MSTHEAKARALAAEMRQQLTGLEEEAASIRRELRRWRSKSLADWVAWEREFGPEIRRAEPRCQVEFCKSLAREYGLPYMKVKAAFVGVWAAR